MVSSLIDTQDETLIPPPPAPAATVRLPDARHRWWSIPIAVVGLLVPAVAALAAALPATLVADKEVVDPADPNNVERVETPFARVPASATAVDQLVSFAEVDGVAEVDGNRTGDIYYVTISEPAQSVLSHWVGENEEAILPLTYEQKYGTSTPAQRQEISLQAMRTSEQVAQYVALNAVGYEGAELIPGDVLIGSLLCLEVEEGICTVSAPADDVLDVGDRITRVDGEDVTTVDDLGVALDERQPGDVVDIVVERPGESEPLTVPVELIAAPDDSGRTIVGFTPFDTTTVRLPFEVDIDTGRVGGPSAGLAFTLTLVDRLSEGNLTGGLDIAVTGTIGLEGEVGAIGGLPQKVAAVQQIGVDHFLVPAAQGAETLAEARRVAGDDVEIIPVATLDEALLELERLGGDAVVGVAS